VLSGDGADEIWGGYKRHYHVALWSRLKRLHMDGAWLAARRVTTALEKMSGHNKTFPVNQLDRLLLAEGASAELLSCKYGPAERAELVFSPALLSANQQYSFNRALPDNTEWDDLARFLFYDMQTFLSGDVLPKVDIATMMNSIEARSPFLDHGLIEFAFSLPTSLRRRNLKDGKYLLKKTFASLLPSGHFARPKMGFSPPLARWLRDLLRDWCGDRLAGQACRDWLNQALLRRLFAEHQNGADHSRKLWLAAIFCEWAEQNRVNG
jgi:asparagine synthase (glutamine-hydrolysing)